MEYTKDNSNYPLGVNSKAPKGAHNNYKRHSDLFSPYDDFEISGGINLTFHHYRAFIWRLLS